MAQPIMVRYAALASVLIPLGACAGFSNLEQRVLSGAAIGAATGAAIGIASGGVGTTTGAAVGAAAGAAAGYVFDKIVE